MNAREVACRLLLRVEQEGAYADRVMSSPSTRSLNSRDRAFAQEVLYGVLRWKLRLDRIIDMYYNKPASTMEDRVRMVLRIGLFQMKFLDTVPDRAAVNETVELARSVCGHGPVGLVNAILRRFARQGEPAGFPGDDVQRLSVMWSHPEWLVARWVDRFGADMTEAMLRAGQEKHRIFVRPSRVGVSSEDVVRTLDKSGYEPERYDAMPPFVSLGHGRGLFDTAAFSGGMFTVQDPASGMAVRMLGPESGMDVLDLCAAPGGKTTLCALLMDDRGSVRALDRNKKRLALVDEHAGRMGLTSIVCEEGDAAGWGDGFEASFDRVLVDAPCTGTGVLAKRPDMKWRITADDVTRLSRIQYAILDNAARLVKPGGRLVYSTCTMEPEEDEDIVSRFLDAHDEYTEERSEFFGRYRVGNGYRISPHQMEGSGAYSALLKRGGR